MRVAIVTGICVENDAISAAVVAQVETLRRLDGIESVDLFAQMCTRRLACDAHVVSNSWQLLCHPRFAEADVAIFHWGIHFDLFDALAIMRGRVADAPGPVPVVHFHNCTPKELVDENHHVTIDRSIAQGQLVVGSDIPVWTYSPFNEATLLGWGVRPEQIVFVPFPVEPTGPLRDRRRPGRVDLLCVGRLVPAKAQHVVVEALAALPPALRDRITLRIAGNELFSSAEYVRTLKQLVADRGLEASVEFVGQPDDAGLWRLYEESHVLVAASQHEGFCVPVLEAYHAGCRVIGADAGNLPFVVQPPDPIVPVLDSRALAAALVRVAEEILTGAVVDRDGVRDLLARHSAASAEEHLRAALQPFLSGSARAEHAGAAT